MILSLKLNNFGSIWLDRLIGWLFSRINDSSFSFLFQMPPKKKTRQSSKNCFGSSAELPDDGNLFTFRDVLAACEKDLEVSPTSSRYEIANRITPKLVAKWKQCNPELILIADTSIRKKVIRAVTTAQEIRLKKLSKKNKQMLLLTSWTSYLIC